MWIEVTSGGFRIYPNGDNDKQILWRIKESFLIESEAKKWEEVWSLNLLAKDDSYFKGYIQK